jgi:sulfide:quinone oxidoreductase
MERTALIVRATRFIGTATFIGFVVGGAMAQESRILVLRGDSLLRLEKPQRALEFYEKAVQADPSADNLLARSKAWFVMDRMDRFPDPKPVIIGAAQGASCYGPAYEFAMIVETELRRRKVRDRVPMTFVTAEPYIGHLGLDGVGDTKGLLESEMRNRHIKWITNAKIAKVEDGTMHVVEELAEDGTAKAEHTLPFGFSMILPAFRGVPAVYGIEGLTNPRGFILADKHQRNPTFKNVYSLGVCVAIPPIGPTPVPVGVPKTGFMIESMVTAIAANLKLELAGKEPAEEATWNAVCLADFGDGGVAFVAQPQIPPRNLNWSSEGKWVHLAKIGFEKYFIHKIRSGQSEPFYEKLALHALGIRKLRFK